MTEALPIPTISATPSVNGEMRGRVQQLRLDNQLGNAKSGGGGGGAAVWLPWGLALLLALSWAGVALRTYRNSATTEETFQKVGATVAGSPGSTGAGTTTTTTNADSSGPAGTVQLEVKGYIISAVQVNISPIDVSGRLMELYFREGQFIKAGEPLAKIDTTNFEFAVTEATQTVNAAKERQIAASKRLAELDPRSVRAIEKDQLLAQIGEAKAAKARADDERRRSESLRGSISARELDTAVNDALAADFRVKKLEIDLRILEEGPRPERLAGSKAELAAAEADVKVAEARLQLSTWRLNNCIVRAPFAGTVTQKGAEVGSLVNPAAFGNISAYICGLADLSDLEVELKIAEKDISKLKPGQVCRIRPDAYPGRLYAGRLDRIMPIAVRNDSTIIARVKITVPNDEPQGAFLKLEMGAVVTFLANDAAAAGK